jgi:hypothetical protein
MFAILALGGYGLYLLSKGLILKSLTLMAFTILIQIIWTLLA